MPIPSQESVATTIVGRITDEQNKHRISRQKKVHYENNKEHILEKMKANPTPAEKRKEYNKKSYLRKKEKLKKEMEEKQNNENI
jgi:hypothetical protein